MLGKTGKLRILTRARKDLGIACGDCTATLAFERAGHDRCAAGLSPGADELVDELDQLVCEADGDLLAHPKMVPDR